MFRAQQNVFDDVVGKLDGQRHHCLRLTFCSAAKATDENLTSENWEYILDVCDKVSSSDSGSKDVVAAMIKRLAHRNANVQLYTLELANALSQNCGVAMHRELASRSFTDQLLRLANERVGDFGGCPAKLQALMGIRIHINKSSRRSWNGWRLGPRISRATLNWGSWSRHI